MESLTYYPGSFGEIIQGNIDGKDLLMSCPVNLFTKVRIFETKEKKLTSSYSKSFEFMKNILNSWGYEKYLECLDIEISSEIPIGKGFASSTADLCGVYHSLIKIFKRQFDEEELIAQCIKIEPTDSIIFNNMTLFDYRMGEYNEIFGEYFEFYILSFEGRKVVDTVEFNELNLPPLKDLSALKTLLKRSIEKQDVESLAKASTVSITENRHRISYPILKEILRIKDETGGLGILGAHSGDALGVIYYDYKDLNNAMKYIKKVTNYINYPLKTLRSIYYENDHDYSTFKW
jgi:L-threonine kinase